MTNQTTSISHPLSIFFSSSKWDAPKYKYQRILITSSNISICFSLQRNSYFLFFLLTLKNHFILQFLWNVLVTVPKIILIIVFYHFETLNNLRSFILFRRKRYEISYFSQWISFRHNWQLLFPLFTCFPRVHLWTSVWGNAYHRMVLLFIFVMNLSMQIYLFV